MFHLKKCLIQLFFIISALIAVIMLNYVTKVLMFKLKIVNKELIDPQPTGKPQIVVKSDVLILQGANKKIDPLLHKFILF